jgi:hypothetical protein
MNPSSKCNRCKTRKARHLYLVPNDGLSPTKILCDECEIQFLERHSTDAAASRRTEDRFAVPALG